MGSGKKYQIDMCHGPLFSKIVFFTIPLMMTNLLQLLFHAADLIVIGQFAPGESLAAVGATNGLTVLVLNIFFGLGTGINVLVARYTGAKDSAQVSRNVHTAAAVAVYWGIAMAIIGIFISKPMLRLMDTPDNIIDKAALYMWIYCAGMPFVIFYNFGSAILRAVGDTKRPMIYMLLAGILNVLLNLFFVLVFKMDVAGVALATKLSNILSAYLVWRVLRDTPDAIQIVWKKVKIHADSLKEMLRIGLPSAIQGACFSISNITIQSSVNSFGWQAIAGNTAAQSLEGLVYVAMSSLFYSAISFTGQNHGAKKYKRIVRSIFYCIICTVTAGIIVGGTILLFGKQLLGIYNAEPDVIQWGWLRLKILLSTYFLCGIMDVISGSLRGLGHSVKPMIVTLIGVCAFRIFWVVEVFPRYRTMQNLMTSYPVSWLLVITLNGLMLFFICRKMLRNARFFFGRKRSLAKKSA